MGINQDGLLTIKAQLLGRIEAISDNLGQFAPAQLAHEMDAIRRTARDYGFEALADMAYATERAIARSEGLTNLRPLVDSMHEALGCDMAHPHLAETFLAMVNTRLYG
jgi:hypothetical protein